MSKAKLADNLRIYVAQKDKKGAVKGSAENCPLARAINRRLPKGYTAQVTETQVGVIDKNYNLIRAYKLSKEATKRIKNYDNKKGFKTGSIRLHAI